jgi:hypothetical protein
MELKLSGTTGSSKNDLVMSKVNLEMQLSKVQRRVLKGLLRCPHMSCVLKAQMFSTKKENKAESVLT